MEATTNTLVYDQIIFKSILYETTTNKTSESTQAIIDELADLIWPTGSSQPDDEEITLSPSTFEFIKSMFLGSELQADKLATLMELADRYNHENTTTSRVKYVFLKPHLDSIYALLDQLESSPSSSSSQIEAKNRIFSLVNQLSVYELTGKRRNDDNKYLESLAMVQRCFKDLCFRFNSIWAHNLDELDENLGEIYAYLLHDYDDDDDGQDDTSSNLTSLAYLFSKIHYEVDKQLAISDTFQDEALVVCSLIKQYSARRDLMWRHLFLFCYCEHKLLLKALLDECLLLIARNQFENLSLVFSVKEFLNLKPLILLLGKQFILLKPFN